MFLFLFTRGRMLYDESHIPDGCAAVWIFDPCAVWLAVKHGWQAAYQCACLHLTLVASTSESNCLIPFPDYILVLSKATFLSTYLLMTPAHIYNICNKRAWNIKGVSRRNFVATVCEWRALEIKMESADRAGIDFALQLNVVNWERIRHWEKKEAHTPCPTH